MEFNGTHLECAGLAPGVVATDISSPSYVYANWAALRNSDSSLSLVLTHSSTAVYRITDISGARICEFAVTPGSEPSPVRVQIAAGTPNGAQTVTFDAVCDPIPACEPGYEESSPGVCTDINECTLGGPSICGTGGLHTCVNTPGSYTCSCDGLFYVNSSILCSVVNPCELAEFCTTPGGICGPSCADPDMPCSFAYFCPIGGAHPTDPCLFDISMPALGWTCQCNASSTYVNDVFGSGDEYCSPSYPNDDSVYPPIEGSPPVVG